MEIASKFSTTSLACNIPLPIQSHLTRIIFHPYEINATTLCFINDFLWIQYIHRCLGQLSKGPCGRNLQKPSSCCCHSQKVYFCDRHVIQSYVNAAYLIGNPLSYFKQEEQQEILPYVLPYLEYASGIISNILWVLTRQ